MADDNDTLFVLRDVRDSLEAISGHLSALARTAVALEALVQLEALQFARELQPAEGRDHEAARETYRDKVRQILEAAHIEATPMN